MSSERAPHERTPVPPLPTPVSSIGYRVVYWRGQEGCCTSTHKGPAIGGPTTSDICLQQQAPFCFSRQNSYEQFLPPTRNCTTIPGPRYFWPQICLPHRYLAPDISIPPNNQTLPIPLTHNQPRQAIQFISLLISLGIVAGIGTGTARLSPMTEFLHCSPEIITILLIGYIPIQK